MKDIYLTSTLHNEWNTKFNPIICEKLEQKGFSVFLPQRDTNQSGPKEDIWKQDIGGMDDAKIVVAVALNETVNWGAEVGYAFGKGQKVIAVTKNDHSIPLIALHMVSKVIKVNDLDDVDGYIDELADHIKNSLN
jgi:nucleoside 2-deoxyribosyltransferase